MLHSKAPGKLILLGEYAVLRGAPALVMAVNRHAHVYLQPSPNGHIVITAPDVGLKEVLLSLQDDNTLRFIRATPAEMQQAKFLKAALETVANHYPMSPVALTISTAEFFYENTTTKLGLGSSAAVTVATIAALLQFIQKSKAEKDAFKFQIMEMALAAHRRAQGKQGSGVDIAASTFGGMLTYRMPVVPTQMPPEIVQVKQPDTLFMRFVWTGRAASTTQLVQQVQHFREQNPTRFNQLMGELIYLAEQGSAAFQRGDVQAFLEIVQEYFTILKELSEASGAPIISPEHQQIAEVARKHQVAYKPSGAGEGDFGILFSENEHWLIDATGDLQKFNFIVYPFKPDIIGVNIERGE